MEMNLFADFPRNIFANGLIPLYYSFRLIDSAYTIA